VHLDRAEEYDFSVSNEMLLEMCKRQDQEALRVLFRRHERPVYNLLYRMLSNREDAEEALAEVFVKVWRSASTFKGDAKFTTWLYRVAANTARDCLRSRMTRQEVSIEDMAVNDFDSLERVQGTSDSPETAAIVSEDRARILCAMQQLSEEDRLLVTLYHFQEFDYDEIERVTGIAPSNLKVKLFRARQRLRKLCAEQEKDGVSDDDMRRSGAESSGLQQGPADWSSVPEDQGAPG
jgi:RNA polymerase sigma factor (sigma-70 family)